MQLIHENGPPKSRALMSSAISFSRVELSRGSLAFSLCLLLAMLRIPNPLQDCRTSGPHTYPMDMSINRSDVYPSGEIIRWYCVVYDDNTLDTMVPTIDMLTLMALLL